MGVLDKTFLNGLRTWLGGLERRFWNLYRLYSGDQKDHSRGKVESERRKRVKTRPMKGVSGTHQKVYVLGDRWSKTLVGQVYVRIL